MKKLRMAVAAEKAKRGLKPSGYRLEATLVRAIKKAAKDLKCNDTDVVRAALKSHLRGYWWLRD